MTGTAGIPSREAVFAGYRAFRSGTAVWVPLLDAHPLRVTGADRVDFMHGQVTNDVRGLAVGHTGEGLVLNHKGHALAQLRVVRRPDDLYVTVEGGAGGFVRDHLERHVVFDQVEIQDLGSTLVAWSLQGAEAAVRDALAALDARIPQVGEALHVPLEDASILVTQSRRGAGSGVDLHLLRRQAPAVQERLAAAGAVEGHPELLSLLRVAGGVPHAAWEGGEGVLPQECGLEPLVSYRKGCYLGQEIMARIEARGAVRRELRGLRLEGEPEGRDVEADGRTVGRLGTSVVHPDLGPIALAVVRKDVPPDAEMRVAGLVARSHPLPFEPAPE